ncbi:MAG: hypothetical protein HYT75_04975 [Deltaproteobacteria bacterium]|nr:hypothetical protein [Deltaproteobacteria bacterium]
MVIISECLSIMEGKISKFSDEEYLAWSNLHIGELEDYFVEKEVASGRVGDIIAGICYKSGGLGIGSTFFITGSAKKLLLKKEDSTASVLKADAAEDLPVSRQILQVDDSVWETVFHLKSETIDLYEKNPPPLIEKDYDPEEWVALDLRLDARLVAALRALRNDRENKLFRLATDEGGQCLASGTMSDCTSGIYYIAKEAENIDALIDYLHIIKNLSDVSRNIIDKAEPVISQLEKVGREIDRRSAAEKWALGPATSFAIQGTVIGLGASGLWYLFGRNGRGGGRPSAPASQGGKPPTSSDGGTAEANPTLKSGGQPEFSALVPYNSRGRGRPWINDRPGGMKTVGDEAVMLAPAFFLVKGAAIAGAGAAYLADMAAAEAAMWVEAAASTAAGGLEYLGGK